MSTQSLGRKRDREDDDETSSSFSAHRSKRRVANLPHRQSPNTIRQASSDFAWGNNYTSNYTSQPAPPTITPADSDSDEAAAAAAAASAEPRSFFSPYSSPATAGLMQSSTPSPLLDSFESQITHSTQMSDAPSYTDDFEMTDSIHFSPGPFQSDTSPSISGRIPTPIHSSFAPFIRAEKASVRREGELANDETMVDRFRRGRRLPSPISEGATSPSTIVAGFEDMQMDVESSSQPDPEKETPTKKGHTRSKHSLRNWAGIGSEPIGGMKRSFSMGYRADCEKCRMKVPGHFSHIIYY